MEKMPGSRKSEVGSRKSEVGIPCNSDREEQKKNDQKGKKVKKKVILVNIWVTGVNQLSKYHRVSTLYLGCGKKRASKVRQRMDFSRYVSQNMDSPASLNCRKRAKGAPDWNFLEEFH